jgi:hypothetical protein
MCGETVSTGSRCRCKNFATRTVSDWVSDGGGWAPATVLGPRGMILWSAAEGLVFSYHTGGCMEGCVRD